MNIRAARIGPTVCELDGPIPIENRSKTETAMTPPIGAQPGELRHHDASPATSASYSASESVTGVPLTRRR
ncbi:hypothetical protein GCM10023107_89790 [Actinoplanes octamycinicus]|nr:hypothetical protein Aoc01nite_65190 [Actinoplanes octamycinicus]